MFDLVYYTACYAAEQCIVIGPVCAGRACDSGRAGGVRTLLQPARAQCLRLSEHFFHCILSLSNCVFWYCPPALRDILLTSMARHSLFVLKVQPVKRQAEKQTYTHCPPPLSPAYCHTTLNCTVWLKSCISLSYKAANIKILQTKFH